MLLTRQSDRAKYVDMTKIDEIGEPKPVIKHIKIKTREADKIIFRNQMRARKKKWKEIRTTCTAIGNACYWTIFV